MPRQKLTLRLNADVIKQAKELGMNLSGFMEIRLREYLTIINQEICNAEEEIRTPERRVPHEISSLAPFQAGPPRQKANTGNKPFL